MEVFYILYYHKGESQNVLYEDIVHMFALWCYFNASSFPIPSILVQCEFKNSLYYYMSAKYFSIS